MIPFIIARASPSGYRQSHAYLLIIVSTSSHLSRQQEVSRAAFAEELNVNTLGVEVSLITI